MTWVEIQHPQKESGMDVWLALLVDGDRRTTGASWLPAPGSVSNGGCDMSSMISRNPELQGTVSSENTGIGDA